MGNILKPSKEDSPRSSSLATIGLTVDLIDLFHDTGDTECRDTDSRSDTTSLRPGRLVSFRLQIGDPIRCDICPDAASNASANPETTDSLAVLVMCWSQILSA